MTDSTPSLIARKMVSALRTERGVMKGGAVAKSVMHTVWYRVGDRHFKVFKVGFGGDGSYYVTAPYHPLDTALVGKVQVNYALERPVVMKEAIAQAMQLAVLDDDEKRLKLSHHPDGFLQFSGEGIVSGRRPDGTPKGIGIMSWKLDRPTYGPSFGVSFYQPDKLGREGYLKPMMSSSIRRNLSTCGCPATHFSTLGSRAITSRPDSVRSSGGTRAITG